MHHHSRVYLGCRLSRPPLHPQTLFLTSGSASCRRPNTPSAYSSRVTGKAPRRTSTTSTPSRPIRLGKQKDGGNTSESELMIGSGRLPPLLRGERRLRGNHLRREVLAGVAGVAGEPDRRGVCQGLHRRRLGPGAGLSQDRERGLGEESGVRVGGGREHCIEGYLGAGFLNIFTRRDNHSSRFTDQQAWTFHIPSCEIHTLINCVTK